MPVIIPWSVVYLRRILWIDIRKENITSQAIFRLVSPDLCVCWANKIKYEVMQFKTKWKWPGFGFELYVQNRNRFGTDFNQWAVRTIVFINEIMKRNSRGFDGVLTERWHKCLINSVCLEQLKSNWASDFTHILYIYGNVYIQL